MQGKLEIHVTHSLELDSLAAAEDLIKQTVEKYGDINPQAGILYAPIDSDYAILLNRLLRKWPKLELIGCTTDGEFTSINGYAEDSCVLVLFYTCEGQVISGAIRNLEEGLDSACCKAYEKAQRELTSAPKLCILLSDVLQTNAESVLECLSKASNYSVPIVGGISGDSWRFSQSKQFFKAEIGSDLSPFLLLAGHFDYSVGTDSGWEPYGEAGIITQSHANVIKEINHKPALQFYYDILGEGSGPSLELPIAIFDENDNFEYLRTTFENFDIETGEVTYLGNTPMGHKVQITMVSRESILNGVKNAVTLAKARFPQNAEPKLALCFSCSARRVLLGTRTKEEYENIAAALPKEIRIAGFYTYGEFCPNTEKKINEFQNETIVVLLLG